MKRRTFLENTLVGGTLVGAAGLATSCGTIQQLSQKRKSVQIQESGKYDILLKGGHVIDPANNIDSVMDVAVADKKIALVDRNIPAADAKKTIYANGLYVTPGLIDIHVHVFTTFELPLSVTADHHLFQAGVTTCADAGTPGPANFEKFLKDVIEPSRSRIFAFINIAAPGMIDAAEQDPRTYDVPLSVRVAKEYPQYIVGHKAAHYWRENEPYDKLHTPWANVDASEEAGRKTGLPVMFDWFPRPASGGYPARTYRELILKKTRPGDIHTHNYARHIPVLNEEGKVNPDIFKAQERGFKFDTGHGSGSFVWRNAVPAVEQGYISDAISSDLHQSSVKGAMLDMPNIMSKYLCMGVPLEDVIRRSTVNPARMINHSELGTLSRGASADIAVLELEKGKFNFLDTSGGRQKGDEKLRNLMTVSQGRIEFDPTGLSYPLWEDVPKDNDYWVNQSGQFY